MLDRVVEIDRGTRAQFQHVARRDHARKPSVLMTHGEVADLKAVHAADGSVGEGLLADRSQRPRGYAADGHSQGAPAVGRQKAHHVALGDDTVGGDRLTGLGRIGDEHGAYLARRHLGDDILHGGDGCNDDRRMAHQVADPVAIGEGINGAECRRRRPRDRLRPPGAVAGLEFGRLGQTGALGLGEGADAALLQPGQQRHENLGGRARVAQCGMAPRDHDPEAGRESVERIVALAGLGQTSQQPNAE